MIVIFIIVVAAVLLAFANGANDNAKGVATLIGSRAIKLQPGLIYAAVATALGSVAAIFIGKELATLFSGKGIVDAQLLGTMAFPACVGLAAGVTVLLATRIGMPISTTHAMVGALTGIGIAADAIHFDAVMAKFFVPLLVSPVIALLASVVIYIIFRQTRLMLGINRETCVCVEETYQPVSISTDGSMSVISTGLTLTAGQASDCCERYQGRVAGIDAQRVLTWAHYFTAGAVSFARGLNDTPKIAALLLAVSWLSPAPGASLIIIGTAIAAGGLLAVRRVAQTMSFGITEMNDGQSFTANLVTAVLVIFASKYGMPVSTTHVSCGSLFGIGAVSGRAHWRVIGQVLLAWVTTLPVAAALGYLAWRVLGG